MLKSGDKTCSFYFAKVFKKNVKNFIKSIDKHYKMFIIVDVNNKKTVYDKEIMKMKLKDLFKKVESANEIRAMYDEKDDYKYCVVFEDECGSWHNFHSYTEMMKWFKEEYIKPIYEFVKDCDVIIDKRERYEFVDSTFYLNTANIFEYKFFINQKRENKNV